MPSLAGVACQAALVPWLPLAFLIEPSMCCECHQSVPVVAASYYEKTDLGLMAQDWVWSDDVHLLGMNPVS